jgi:hypothetical protein
MLGRIIRLAPLAAAGWRMYQNYKRRNGADQARTDGSTPPPQSYRG